MKWFTQLCPDAQVFVSMVFLFTVFVVSIVVAGSIEIYNKSKIREKAIEAGLHQEVIDGHVLWVK